MPRRTNSLSLLSISVSTGLFLTPLLCSMGCGGKDTSATNAGTSAASSGTATAPVAQMPAEARSAMQAQQKTESNERAMHSKKPGS